MTKKTNIYTVVALLIFGFVFMPVDVSAVPPEGKPPSKAKPAKLLRKYIRDGKSKEKLFVLNNGKVVSSLMPEDYSIIEPVELEPKVIGGPDIFSSLEGKHTRKKALKNYIPAISMIEVGINKPVKREVMDISPDGEYLFLRFFKWGDDTGPPNCPGTPCSKDMMLKVKHALVRADGSKVWSTKYTSRGYDIIDPLHVISPAKNFILDNFGSIYNLKGEKIGQARGGLQAISRNGKYIVVARNKEHNRDSLVLYSSAGKELWVRTIKEENPLRYRKNPNATLYSTAISPSGETILAAAEMYTYIFNNKGEILGQLQCNECKNISFFGDQKVLIAKGRSILYDLAKSRKIWDMGPQHYGFSGRSFSAGNFTSDGKFVALGSHVKRKRKDGGMAGLNQVMILDERGKPVWMVRLEEWWVKSVRFINNDKELVVETGNKIFFFDVSEVTGGGE